MKKRYTIARFVSVCLLLLTSVNALIAGLLFIIDPTGEKMNMPVSYLSNSPFNNFFIPGLTLFIVNGLMNGVVAITCIKNYKHYPWLILAQGLLLSGWIVIQVIMVRDFNALHCLMLVVGFTLIACAAILLTRPGTVRPNINAGLPTIADHADKKIV